MNSMIFDDDPVPVVKAKIADAIGVPHTEVYMWADLECDVTADDFAKYTASRLLARDVLRTPHDYTWDDIVERAACLFPGTGFGEHAGPASSQAVLQFVRDLKVSTTSQALGPRWWARNQVELLRSADPFEDIKMIDEFAQFNKMRLRTDSKHAYGLLQQLYIANRTLHVATLSDVLAACPDPGDAWFNGYVRFYFPYARQQHPRVEYTLADATITETMSKVATREWVHAAWIMKHMHVRVRSTQPATHDIHKIFNTFDLNKRMQMIKYVSPELEQTFRISSAALHEVYTRGDTQLLHALSEAVSRGRGSVVVWMVLLPPRIDGKCLVRLASDLQLDVTFTFRGAAMDDAMTCVEDVVALVNDAIIGHMRSTLPSNTTISDIEEAALWDPPREGSNTEVVGINVATAFFDEAAIVPSIDDFTQGMQGLDPLLRVIPGVSSHSKDTVLVQYARVARYEPLDQIKYFAMRHASYPPKALVRTLKRKFRADSAYAHDVVASLDGTLPDIVTARVTCNGAVNMKVHVIGARHLHEARRVVDVIKHAWMRAVLPKNLVPVVQRKKHTHDQDLIDLIEFLDEFDEDEDGPADALEEENTDDIEETNDAKQVESHLALDGLQRADPSLFSFGTPKGYRSYASQCGKVDQRQPVVMSAAEKQRHDKVNPEGYGGDVPVLYGSDASTMHYYACPDVWCPKSKVGMTYEQLESGRKCPNPSEKPLAFDSKYWLGRSRKRRVGFIPGANHPRGLCMPCCFKIPAKNFDGCLGRKNDERDKSYIKEFRYVLDEGRVSLLPDDMHAWLNPIRGKCGIRKDGSGNTGENTDCLVRLGLPEQSFLDIMMGVLEADAGRLVSSIDADTFVRLEGGAVARFYLPLAQDPHAAGAQDGAMRDALIERAMTLFVQDVTTEAGGGVPPWAARKLTHAFLQEAIARAFGVDIVVFDLRVSDEKNVSVHVRPTRVGSKVGIGVIHWSSPVAKYELIVRARHSTGKALRLIRTLDATGHLASVLDDPVSRTLAGWDNAARQLGWSITKMVLDSGTMFACGIILTRDDNALFVPCPDPIPCTMDGRWEWVFLDAVVKIPQKHRASSVHAVLAALADVTGDPRWSADPENLLDATGIVVAIRMGNHGIIPLDSDRLSKTPHAKWFAHGLDVLLRSDPDDPRLVHATSRIADDVRVDDIVPGVLGVLAMDNVVWQELKFLASDINPFDMDFRKQQTQKIIGDALRGMNERDMPARLLPRVVERTTHALLHGMDASVRTVMRDRPRERVLNAFQVSMLISGTGAI